MNEDNQAWRVVFTRRAGKDIRAILAFIGAQDGPDVAEAIAEKFIAARDGLRQLPDRGRIPPELQHVNILTFREIQIKPYRIVYQVNKTTHEVYIHVVADGRRNFAELLRERLLLPRQ